MESSLFHPWLVYMGSCLSRSTVVRFDIWDDAWHTVRLSTPQSIDRGYLSAPEGIEFPTANNLTSFGLYYAPTNKDYTGPAGEKPPLVVIIKSIPSKVGPNRRSKGSS